MAGARDGAQDGRGGAAGVGEGRARVAVLGSAGYVGAELLRLLVAHPRVELVRAVSQSQAGTRVDRHHRHLRGATDLVFSGEAPLEAAAGVDVVFLALTHRESMQVVAALRPRLEAGDAPLVIDMAGSHRLLDPAAYRAAYGEEHVWPEVLPRFVYGLPELGAPGGLAGARLVASPGCFATAAALAAGPLVEATAAREGGLAGPLALVGFTGASGSGAQAKPTTHFPLRDGNLYAYRVLAHQHEPEVRQTLERLAAAGSCLAPPPAGAGRAPVDLVLTTCSAPITRGIHMTLTAALADPGQADAVRAAYARRYGAGRFVRLVDAPAELKGLVGTNGADVHLAVRGRHVVVTCTIDNLVKGAAGQGVQCMNLALGLDEGLGLGLPGLFP